MGLSAATLGYIALGISAAGTAASIYQGRKSREAQEEAREAQIAQGREQNRRARAQAIERARRRRAAVTAQAQAQGALQSSPVQGALGAFESDVASNIQFQRQIQQLESQRLGALGEASERAGRARTFSAIGQLPGQLGFSPAKSFASLLDQGGGGTTGNFSFSSRTPPSRTFSAIG